MRVITGTAKGKKLKELKVESTRPILDRVKVALFDIISPRIADARFLDLFAGTGQVGIEALSRHAAAATFIEMNAKAAALVRENLTLTNLTTNAQVIVGDAFAHLRTAKPAPYSIIFVAPPQYLGLAFQALTLIDARPELLTADGLVIVQIHPKEREEPTLAHLTLTMERKYGNTLLLFYEVRLTSEG